MQGPLAQAVNDYRALELKAHIIGSNLAKRTDSSKALLKAMLDLRMGVKTLTESNKGNGYTLTVDSVSKPTRLAVSRSGYCFEGTFKDLKSLTESQTLTGFQGEAQPGGVCPS
jgi:hypothetical protein